MHELAITENILNVALEHAEKVRAIRVTRLHLVLGELSSVVDDSVQFYWDILSRGTICHGARLCFERVPSQLNCQDCGARYPLQGGPSPCPECGSSRVRICQGLEFRLDSMDVETDDQEDKKAP